jgi:hypothetical protein
VTYCGDSQDGALIIVRGKADRSCRRRGFRKWRADVRKILTSTHEFQRSVSSLVVKIDGGNFHLPTSSHQTFRLPSQEASWRLFIALLRWSLYEASKSGLPLPASVAKQEGEAGQSTIAEEAGLCSKIFLNE